MQKEIKEILDKLKESVIWYDDSKLLLDYITNLQEENKQLNNIIDELTEEYINYMDKQDFAKKCNISRPYLDKLLKKMNRKEIYEFCKIRNKLKEK